MKTFLDARILESKKYWDFIRSREKNEKYDLNKCREALLFTFPPFMKDMQEFQEQTQLRSNTLSLSNMAGRSGLIKLTIPSEKPKSKLEHNMYEILRTNWDIDASMLFGLLTISFFPGIPIKEFSNNSDYPTVPEEYLLNITIDVRFNVRLYVDEIINLIDKRRELLKKNKINFKKPTKQIKAIRIQDYDLQLLTYYFSKNYTLDEISENLRKDGYAGLSSAASVINRIKVLRPFIDPFNKYPKYWPKK